jgi:hypothetical protein
MTLIIFISYQVVQNLTFLVFSELLSKFIVIILKILDLRILIEYLLLPDLQFLTELLVIKHHVDNRGCSFVGQLFFTMCASMLSHFYVIGTELKAFGGVIIIIFFLLEAALKTA